MDKYEHRRQRLRKLIEELAEGSPAEFARRFEYDKAQISQYLSKTYNRGRSMGEPVIEKLEEKTGRGGWFSAPPHGSRKPVTTPREDGGTGIEIDRLAAAGSMGNGTDVLPGEDQVVERMTLTGNWIQMRLPRISSPLNLKVISAYGDSMMPTFNDGDLLLVDVGVQQVDIDGVFVLRTHQRRFIKRVRQKLDGTFMVSSDNPSAGTPEELSGKHQIEVEGRVVWAWNGKKL